MKKQDKRDAFTALGFLILLSLVVLIESAVTGRWIHIVNFLVALAAAGAAILSLRMLRKLARKIWP